MPELLVFLLVPSLIMGFMLLFVIKMQAVFSQTGSENETVASPPPTPNAFGAMASFLVPKLSAGLGGTSQDKASSSDQSKVTKKERHAIRPPVRHNWSLPGSGRVSDPPQIFQHELLQNFSFNMFCKVRKAHCLLLNILRVV